jgi:hypothetical protein
VVEGEEGEGKEEGDVDDGNGEKEEVGRVGDSLTPSIYLCIYLTLSLSFSLSLSLFLSLSLSLSLSLNIGCCAESVVHSGGR